MTDRSDVRTLGQIAVDHLPPILYALEVCAVSMDEAGRSEEARYYRELARQLAEAAGEREEGVRSKE